MSKFVKATVFVLFQFCLAATSVGQTGKLDSWPTDGDNVKSTKCQVMHGSVAVVYQQFYVESNRFWWSEDDQTVQITFDPTTKPAQELLERLTKMHQHAVEQGCVKFVPRKQIID